MTVIQNVIDWNLKKIKDPRTPDRDRERYRQNIKNLEGHGG
jgi:hypothetical protein